MEKTTGSFFYITSFYRSFFAVIGGLLLILISINGLKKDVDDFPKTSGIIEKAHLYWDKSPYNIKLKDNSQWYSVYPEKYYSILQEKVVPGKKAEIWYNPKNNSIKKLVIEGEELRPYVKSVGVYISFIIVGSIFLIFNFIYILRNPSHAKGKKGEIKNNA